MDDDKLIRSMIEIGQSMAENDPRSVERVKETMRLNMKMVYDLLTGEDAISRRFQAATKRNIETQQKVAEATTELLMRYADAPDMAYEVIVANAEKEVAAAEARVRDFLGIISQL